MGVAPLTSTTNDRNAMMFRTNSAEKGKLASHQMVESVSIALHHNKR